MEESSLTCWETYLSAHLIDHIACVHHYFTKSVEEFNVKCHRRLADAVGIRDCDEAFRRHDLNEVEDRSACSAL
jgi:hypothetical protein